MKVAFMGDEREIERVFSQGRRSRIEERAEVLPGVLSANDDFASEVEAIFSTWGMPLLSEAQLDRMHRLRAVFMRRVRWAISRLHSSGGEFTYRALGTRMPSQLQNSLSPKSCFPVSSTLPMRESMAGKRPR